MGNHKKKATSANHQQPESREPNKIDQSTNTNTGARPKVITEKLLKTITQRPSSKLFKPMAEQVFPALAERPFQNITMEKQFPTISQIPPRMEHYVTKQKDQQNNQAEPPKPISTLPSPSNLATGSNHKSYSEIVQKQLNKQKPAETTQGNAAKAQVSQSIAPSTNSIPGTQVINYANCPYIPSVNGVTYMYGYQPSYYSTMYTPMQPISGISYIPQTVNPIPIYNYPQQVFMTGHTGEPYVNYGYSMPYNNYYYNNITNAVPTQPATYFSNPSEVNTNFQPLNKPTAFYDVPKDEPECSVVTPTCFSNSYKDQYATALTQRPLRNIVPLEPATEEVFTAHIQDIPTVSINDDPDNMTRIAKSMTYSPLFSVLNCNSFLTICYNDICSYNSEKPQFSKQFFSATRPYMTFTMLRTICPHYGRIFPVIPMLPCCMKVYNSFACPKCKFCIEFVRGLISEFNSMSNMPKGIFKIADLYDILTKSSSICTMANILTSRDSLLPYKYHYARDNLKEQSWFREIQKFLVAFLLDQDKNHHDFDHYAFIIVILASHVGKSPIYKWLHNNIFYATEATMDLVTINQKIKGTAQTIKIESLQKCIDFTNPKTLLESESNTLLIEHVKNILDE